MREQAAYREILEDINQRCGGGQILTVKQVADYTGRDPRWCKKKFDINAKTGICAVNFAMKLAAM